MGAVRLTTSTGGALAAVLLLASGTASAAEASKPAQPDQAIRATWRIGQAPPMTCGPKP